MIDLHLSRKCFNDCYLSGLTDYSHRYEVYYGGAGSGKSYAIVQKLIVKACASKRKVLVMRKVMSTTRDSTWRLFIDMLSQWQLLRLCKLNSTNYEITLPNGSVFLFYGLDDPEKIKSIAGITDIWCEEATEFTEEDIAQLDLRLRAKEKDLQFFFSFNPISKANWVYSRWFAGAPVSDDTVVIKTTYKDNRFLPESYVKTLEGMMETNPAYYAIYALGDFASLDKLVYTRWHEEEFDYRTIQGKLLCGLDFGFVTDTTAFIASIMTKDRIYIFKSWGDTGITNDGIALAIKSLGFSKSIIVADSAEPKSIEELRRSGLSRVKASVKGRDSIIHGIQRLQQYELVVHPSCTEVITELQNYSWKKDRKTGAYVNEPIDSFNHYLDALRYSMQCHDNGHLRLTSKSLLGL